MPPLTVAERTRELLTSSSVVRTHPRFAAFHALVEQRQARATNVVDLLTDVVDSIIRSPRGWAADDPLAAFCTVMIEEFTVTRGPEFVTGWERVFARINRMTSSARRSLNFTSPPTWGDSGES